MTVAAVTLAAYGAPRAVAQVRAAVGPGFTPARRKFLASFAETANTASGVPTDALVISAQVDSFAAQYKAFPAAQREAIDESFDAIENAIPSRAFSDLSLRSRGSLIAAALRSSPKWNPVPVHGDEALKGDAWRGSVAEGKRAEKRQGGPLVVIPLTGPAGRLPDAPASPTVADHVLRAAAYALPDASVSLTPGSRAALGLDAEGAPQESPDSSDMAALQGHS